MTFEEIVKRAKDLESEHSDRNDMFEQLEKMYLLEAGDLPTESWIKETVSTDPRDALQGAQRLLVASDPTFSVPISTNNPVAQRTASKVEKFCAATWTAMGVINNAPLHYDIALSALLYGEVHLAITLLSDLEKTAKTPAQKTQIKEAQKRTPFIIEVINPAFGFPVWGPLGLSEYCSKRQMTVQEVRNRWGDDVLAGKKATDNVYYWDYWDLEIHVAWVDGEAAPFLNAPHNLPYIPIVAAIAEGSRLFWRDGQQTRQPLLYALWKSELWHRQNLSLTIMYSLIFSIGANPLFVWRRNDPNKEAPYRDFSTPGGLIALDAGEDYASLAKQTLDPSILQGLDYSRGMSEQSTIYRQALGQPLSDSGAPFSTVALLSQAGRQPLISFQRIASFAIGKAMLIGLTLVKEVGGGKLSAMGDKGLVDLSVKDLPDDLDLVATLDINMPQDDRAMVAVAAQAVGGERPLMSLRAARERFLKIGQSDDMEQEIMDETYLKFINDMKLQQRAQEFMAQQQQQQQPLQPQGRPEMMGQSGAQPSPQDMLAQLQQTGAQPGIPGIPAGAPIEPGAPGGIGGVGGPGQETPQMGGM
jgi:hypothetical protein